MCDLTDDECLRVCLSVRLLWVGDAGPPGSSLPSGLGESSVGEYSVAITMSQ